MGLKNPQSSGLGLSEGLKKGGVWIIVVLVFSSISFLAGYGMGRNMSVSYTSGGTMGPIGAREIADAALNATKPAGDVLASLGNRFTNMTGFQWNVSAAPTTLGQARLNESYGLDDDLSGRGYGTPTSSTTTPKWQNGCVCESWNCPTTIKTSTSTTKTTTTKTSTTTTTCIVVAYPEYVPSTKNFRLVMRNGKFRPDTLDVFVGDTAVILMENTKGLYRFYDPLANRSVVMKPGDVYVTQFFAEAPGDFVFGCLDDCDEPVKATFRVVKPSRTLC
jgi:hypothetical protein